ncbi:MAG: hypothetical protein DRP59_08450 [Spirochaetes bacterium]|nr:MAG: hypothetical protein DRP59_08450 [Spirochaetota bacterium]
MTISRVLQTLTTPNRCLLCSTDLISEEHTKYPLCSSCRKKLLSKNADRRCPVCSIPLSSEETVCTRCRSRSFSYESNFSLFTYRKDIKELLYQYKFRNNRRLAVLFAELFYTLYLKQNKFEAIIPVPSTISNVKKRGWDHTGEITGILKSRYGIPVMNCLRKKGGKSQKKLSYAERLTNLDGKITVTKTCGKIPSKILLLDDVFTTGATLEQCALVLIKAGCFGINALTLAID